MLATDEKIVKIIDVDILKLRSQMLDEAYKNINSELPKWNGTKSGSYLKKKVVQQFIINKLNNILNNESIKTILHDHCRHARIFIDNEANEYIILDKLINKDLFGVYMGKTILE